MANRARVLAARAERAAAEAKLGPVPPERARRWMRVGLAAGVAGPLALIVASALMVRVLHVNEAWTALSPFLGCLALFAPLFVLNGTPVSGRKKQSPELLNFRTVTGRRTLDLSRLTRVRRLVLPSRGPWNDALVLTDQYGVRVVVMDAQVIDQVKDLMARQRAGGLSQRPLIRCSSRAVVRTGSQQRSSWVRAVRSVLLVVGMLGLVELAFAGAIFLALGVSGAK